MCDLIGNVSEHFQQDHGYEPSTDAAIDFLEGAWINWTADLSAARNEVTGLFCAANGIRNQREAAAKNAAQN